MSWDTKDLKFKNGVPIPQQFDPAVDDWVVYTNEDIKELRTELALVKTELQTIKENQISGEQKVRLDGNNASNFNFHFNVSEPGEGETLTVNGEKHLTIEIFGTGDARTVQFRGKGRGGVLIPITGIRTSDLQLATETHSITREMWQFDITGIDKIAMPITSLNGSAYVLGRVVV